MKGSMRSDSNYGEKGGINYTQTIEGSSNIGSSLPLIGKQ